MRWQNGLASLLVVLLLVNYIGFHSSSDYCRFVNKNVRSKSTVFFDNLQHFYENLFCKKNVTYLT